MTTAMLSWHTLLELMLTINEVSQIKHISDTRAFDYIVIYLSFGCHFGDMD